MTTVPEKIQQEIQKLEPSAVIELYQLQLTAAVNGADVTYYYHAGTYVQVSSCHYRQDNCVRLTR